MKNELTIEIIENDGPYKSQFTYNYTVKEGLNVTGGRVNLDESENRKSWLEQSIKRAIKHYADHLGDQLAKKFKKELKPQIDKEVMAYLEAHKEKLLKDSITAAKKKALRRYDELINDYYED